jgi:hypothetical protein
MNPDIWNAIEIMFSKHPVMKAGPVAYEEIDAAANIAGVKLPEDYREFIHRYGGAFVGPLPIIGSRKAPAMARSESSAFEVTERFRRQGWGAVKDWLIISVDHAGNPIGLDRDGKVWIHDHDAGVIEPIAENFEDFLRKRCLK